MTNLIITLSVVIMLLIVIMVYIVSMIQDVRKQNKTLKEELSAEKERIGYLMRHIEELAKIKQEEKSINNKIQEAKSDEEICDIVSAIINANNSRVQNYKAKKQN